VNAAYVAGLLRERGKYVQSGRADRVRQVDVELARFGVVVDDPPEAAVEEPPERAVQRRPRARKPNPTRG
jgi:hypothetical protein